LFGNACWWTIYEFTKPYKDYVWTWRENIRFSLHTHFRRCQMWNVYKRWRYLAIVMMKSILQSKYFQAVSYILIKLACAKFHFLFLLELKYANKITNIYKIRWMTLFFCNYFLRIKTISVKLFWYKTVEKWCTIKYTTNCQAGNSFLVQLHRCCFFF